MGHFAIRALSVAFFVGSCFLVAEIGNQWAATWLHVAPTATSAAANSVEPAARSWSARQPILDRNLFGARLEAGDEAVAEIIDEEVEETQLPLTLLATIAALETGISRAAIHDQRSRSNEILRVGDALESHPNVTVDRIERGRVLLLNRGRHEELKLEEADILAARRPPAPGGARRSGGRNLQYPKNRIPSQLKSPGKRAAHEELRDLGQRLASGEMTQEEVLEAMKARRAERER